MRTGYIQIFSEQAATFNHPKDYNTKVSVNAFKFEEVPEWVMDSAMFNLLTKARKLRVINGKNDVAKVEIANGKISKENTIEAMEKAEEKEVDYTSMKAKKLYELCVEKGIEVEPQQSKDYYLEKLNA